MVNNYVIHSIIDQRPKQDLISLLRLGYYPLVVLETKLHIVHAVVHHHGQHGDVNISGAGVELNIAHMEGLAGRGQFTEVPIVVLGGITLALLYIDTP